MSKHTHNGEDEAFSPEPKNIIWTVPNAISFLRILSIPVIAVLISKRYLVWSLIVLAISSASDGVDGYIARKFDQVSRIGQILDPIADRLLIIFSMLALGWAQILPWWLLIAVGSRDVVMLGEVLLLSDRDYGPLPVHFVGKAGTALLLMSVPVLIVADLSGSTFFQVLHLIGVAGAIWGAVLYWCAGLIYIMQGHALLSKDKRRANA
ncbi:CDP-diacylglycerol--glycerol-3-phosphate 3-phosphatidyltransferase [Bifidobacterium primatium]|uniref:CDP-diacylglycerol--glycerol-3-phosphate 3-phosphatidyltransferase n=1 Tax=Bifidobacterium primatium TaxID=2045438 RepID=A0A2M9H7R1_9BIFI|nr:CDP-alcohol phosphatidyltransferase family protein [Bifidobacterium primatium]PJM72845.1 CDP-diacylglycerol--glycerol-3-phosphate 3-phosphatidyltransferase [Bifidobacterium primatium]